ncbi:MAG: FHA domain-containing protein, partial [Archangium sp.]|nr:FHA domain-containing protein [Archangium sp.]
MLDTRTRRTEKLSSPLLRLDAEGALHHISWTVRVVGGPDQGKGLEVTRAIVVGGGDGVDLRLSDAAVSGQHVQLEPRPDGVFVKDLGSTNGTLIGGARVEAAIVEGQAVITIGRTMLSLTMSDERDEVGAQLERLTPELHQQRANQLGKVVAPLTQRRHAQGRDREPEVEV